MELFHKDLHTIDRLYFRVLNGARPIATFYFENVLVTGLGHNESEVIRLNPLHSACQRIYITPTDIESGVTKVYKIGDSLHVDMQAKE